MPRPTAGELALIQRYIDLVRERADARGLSIHLDNDAQAFVSFLSAQEETHGVSAIHDPGHCYITPDDFLWMRIDDDCGVFCHAIRMIRTDDLIAEVVTHRLFDNLNVSWRFDDVDLYPEAHKIRLGGRIGIGGGLWVHKQYRGRDYSALFRKLLRVMAVRRFRMDHYATFILNTHNRRAWVLGSYGSPNATPLLRGYYPPYDRQLDVQLAYATRRDILMRAQQELESSDPTTL